MQKCYILKKFNRKSASPLPPPLLRKPAPTSYLHPFFNFSDIPPPPRQVMKMHSPPLKRGRSELWKMNVYDNIFNKITC